MNRRAWLRGLVPKVTQAVAQRASDHLEAVLPEPEPPRPRLVLHRDRCFTFRGPECGACAGYCPPEAAGALRIVLCKPVIDPEVCVGCGGCILACPTLPVALEIIMPVELSEEADEARASRSIGDSDVMPD